MAEIIRALSHDKRIRVIWADLCDVSTEISGIHQLCGDCAELFAHTVVGTVLLGADLKNDGTNISAVLRSAESDMSAVVIFNKKRMIKGYLRSNDTTGYGFERLNGNGSLTVMCDDGRMGLYTSTVPLNACSMEKSMEEYLRDSQQHEGLLRFDNGQARGIMIMPVLNDEISFVNDRKQELEGMITSAFEEPGRVKELLRGHGFDILGVEDAHWGCDCSKEGMENVVRSVGRQEAESIIEEMGAIEIVCPYCKKEYRFEGEATKELFAASVNE